MEFLEVSELGSGMASEATIDCSEGGSEGGNTAIDFGEVTFGQSQDTGSPPSDRNTLTMGDTESGMGESSEIEGTDDENIWVP